MNGRAALSWAPFAAILRHRMPRLADLSPAIEQSETLFCTVVTRSHLTYAWALRQSLRRFHPDIPFCVLVVDALAGDELPEEAHFDCPLVRLDAFLTPKIADMTIYYTAYELCGDIKPAFLLHLFETTAARRILYLDSDLFITGPVTAALGLLDCVDVTATPHILSPLPDDGSEPSDLTVAVNGVYNTGFMGFVGTPAVRDMLAWMGERVYRRGFNAFSQGMFCEQRFFNLGVTFLGDRFRPIRLDGYNVAYWNLHERTIEKRDGVYFVNGRRVTFFHMSGFDPDVSDRLSKHEQRHTLATHPQGAILKVLCADYRDMVLSAPFPAHQGYRFDTHNGIALTPAVRRHYYEHGSFSGRVSLDEALAMAGRCARDGDHDRAARICEVLLCWVPWNVGALLVLGRAAARTGRDERARRAFRRVLALVPDHEEAGRFLRSADSSAPL